MSASPPHQGAAINETMSKAPQIAVILAALAQQVDLATTVIQHCPALKAMRRLRQQAHQRLADQRLAGPGLADNGQGLALDHIKGNAIDHRARHSRHPEAD